MDKNLKGATDFLVALGIEKVAHTKSTYLAHLLGLHHYMQKLGCTDEVCRAGLFHSIYGTQLFQGFKLPLERRADIRSLVGERAERLAYLNCAMDRALFDRNLDQAQGPYCFVDRITGQTVQLDEADFNDLCRVHLFDLLEQVPRSKCWGYRRDAYHKMAQRLGGPALEAYDEVFAEAAAVGGPDMP
jgi:hypothetical protein